MGSIQQCSEWEQNHEASLRMDFEGCLQTKAPAVTSMDPSTWPEPPEHPTRTSASQVPCPLKVTGLWWQGRMHHIYSRDAIGSLCQRSIAYVWGR